MNRIKQTGFTLVEIAIVLVIIGLLLGGILKGQELINSARVRNLADQNSGIQAAYYGFIDRYRRVPGDWNAARAQEAIGATPAVANGGNEDGQINAGNWGEASALWEQLSKAGFIQGNYTGGAADAGTYADPTIAPVNAFSGYLLLARNQDFTEQGGVAATNPRFNLHLGDNIPVNIARELDVKVDDGMPDTGVMREAGQIGADFDTVNESSSADCQAAGATGQIYNIQADAQSCNQVFLY